MKLFTKKTSLEWFKSTKSVFEDKNFYKIYIDYPRDILVNKIHNRAKDMIYKGAILEAKKFLNMKVSKKRTATKACLLYTSPSPRDVEECRIPSSA